METSSTPVLQEQMPDKLAQSTEPSTQTKDNKADVKGLLAEARNTRDMLVGFRAAVESGTYHGSKMLDLAKGLAFMDAILNQNNTHIKNLQERMEK